jgi:hypothetical protein
MLTRSEYELTLSYLRRDDQAEKPRRMPPTTWCTKLRDSLHGRVSSSRHSSKQQPQPKEKGLTGEPQMFFDVSGMDSPTRDASTNLTFARTARSDELGAHGFRQ